MLPRTSIIRHKNGVTVLLLLSMVMSLVNGAAIDNKLQERDPVQHKTKRQAVTVGCFTDKTDSQCGGMAMEMDSIASCCQGPGYFYSLQDSMTCETCIVIGWVNVTTQTSIDNFAAREDPIGYDIRVDYIKGSGLASNLRFMVIDTNFTASDTDYFLSTPFVNLGGNVRVSLRPDALALEDDEVFQLKLMPTNSFTGRNEFLMDTLNVTIIDNDIASVFFSEVDYSLTPEDAQNLTAVVVRNTAIATPITVLVYPLNNTYVNQTRVPGAPPVIFEGEPLQLSNEIVIPPNVPERPSVAKSGADFDTAPIRIVIEPSELNQQDYPFNVKVTPDTINEADQSFVLILRVESVVRRESVDTAVRNTTRCIINDDDPIFLSFEYPVYELTELEFEEVYVNVAVIKSNNLTTEQLLEVYFQIEPPMNTSFPLATDGEDFFIGRVVVRQIIGDVQRLQLVISIFSDNILEGVESFGIGISNERDAVQFDFGDFPSTVVNIVERRTVSVGFETNFTAVPEDIGSFELCVSIRTPMITISENVQFSLNLFSVQDTADTEDYVEIGASNNPLVPFTSDPSTHRQCFNVTIIDDRALEDTERFSLSLTLGNVSIPRLNVVVDPDFSEVEILDEDEVTVGFERNFTSINESIGLFELCIRIFTEATLLNITFDFTLDLKSVPVTADGTDYIELTSSNNPLVPFTSDPSTHRQCFNVTIIDDGALEDIENFLLSLTLSEDSTIPVDISPSISEVNIIDNDVALVGFERKFTSIDENVGSFQLCVAIVTDASLLPRNTEFSLDLLSIADSADMTDFVELTSSNNPLVPFTSDPSTHRQCFNVTIIDDGALEDIERFSLSLELAGGNIPVVVNPDISEVEILDGDFILVGFETNFTSVDEGDGVSELCVRIFTEAALLPNHTEINFSLDLISMPGSAGATDFVQITASNNPLVPFTSDPSTYRQCFNVTIIDDRALEDTEDFFLSLTIAENSTIPVVVIPDTLQVEIVDNDVITVGFEDNFTSVSEGIGSFELCVSIFTEAIFLPMEFKFSLDLATAINTADADDYEEITTSNDPLLSFTEDPSTHQQCFNVTITDDEFLEDTERFSLVLSLAEGSTVPVEIMPPTSEVEITDDDYILVGFDRGVSQVDEDMGSVELCVRIFTDPAFLPTHVSTNFSLNLVSIPGTADETDFVKLASSNNPLVPFTSDPSTHRQCFNVTIIDDGALEDTERFSLSLSLVGGANVPVVVEPDISEVEIVDRDLLIVGFETNFTSVDERIGFFELCVRIFTETSLLPTYTNISFSLNLVSVPDTADGTDFVEITSSNNPLAPFTSDPSTHRQCFNVTITNDGALEDTERFSLSLELAGGNIPVIVNPDVSEVEILDNDEIHVGFERIFTPVTEDIGSLELCVEIFTDAFLLPANFDFSLNLVTISGTADIVDFDQITASNNPLVPFTSDPSTHRQCFNVTIIDDEALEDTERFNLSLSLASSTVPVLVIPDTSEVEIEDQDVITVGFERNFTSVGEDIGSFELCVSILTDSAFLPTHTAINFTLDLVSQPGTADINDYAELSSSNNPLVPFTSDPSTHRQCFNVTIIDDGALEDTERFSLSLTLAGGSNVPVVVNPAVSEVEIVDRDILLVGFETNFTSVDERIGSFELCARIFTEAALFPMYTNFSFSLDLVSVPGTAVTMDFVEFTSSNNPLVPFTSDPSTHRQCFNVTIIDDGALEDIERFSLSLDLAGGNIPVVVNPDVSEVEILDNDAILVGFERNFTTVDEDIGSFRLCVMIFTNISFLPTSFEFFLSLGTMPDTAGATDYVELTSSNNPLPSFTSDPSTHRQCFNVTIINDDFLEDVERFSLSLTLAVSSTVPVIIIPDTSEVEIEDRDVIVVGFERILTSVDEDIGSFELCVSILTDSVFLPTHTAINFTLDLVSLPGTADADDYIEITSSNNPLVPFTSDPSTHRQCFNVTIIDDGALEDTERFSLSLSLDGEFTVPVFVSPDVSEVEIIDNDVILVGFEQIFTRVDEEIGSFEICIKIFTSTSHLPVDFGFSLNLITMPGTAGPNDYIEITSSNNPLAPFTSDPSAHRQCFNVTIIDDGVIEDTERFSLTLSLAGATVPVLVIPNTSEVEIEDQDVITVGFERVFTSVDEDIGSFELCVSILTDSAFLPTHTAINFTLDLVSLPGTADANDYVQLASSNNSLAPFTSDPSTHRQCFNVTIIDDGALEDTERFSLSLTLAEGANVPVEVDPDVSEVEIIDRDDILVGFETIFISADEGNDSVELCVRIFNEAALLPTHINISFSLDLVSVSDTADTEDYVEIDVSNNPLVPFTSDPSTHRQCFNVTIIDDGALEDTEEFFLQLSLAGGSNVPVFVSPDASTIEITDNDYVTIGFELTAVLTEETVGVVTLVVSVLDGGTTTPITVAISTQNGTATSPLDFTGVEQQLIFFNETETSFDIEVIIINDGIVELNEYFVAVLTLLDPLLPPSKIMISPALANVTIVDGSPVDRVNDTVIGDPLLTVPLLVSNLDNLGLDQNLSLCYEVHGQSDKYFNLVSDICTSVSAHYVGVSSFNVIDEIGVRAVDNSRNCRDILISKEGGGTVTVDGEAVTRFSEGGISVRKYQHHVRIAVPNCAHVDLVMWIICQNRTLTDYNDQGDKISVSVIMMKFVIARGFNLQQSSHGIIGQFWNVPVIAEPYNGTVFDIDPVSSLNFYTVTVSHPDSPVRRFAAFFWPRSWEIVRGEYQPCLYAGSHQAGKTDEIEGYGDPVIEGLYTDYIVSGPFDTEFEYSRFEQRRCR